MDKRHLHDMTEYVRLNNELTSRMDKFFSQGYTLVSIIAVIWSLTLGGAVAWVSGLNNIKDFGGCYAVFASTVILGIVFTLLFGIPIFLVSPFAVKNHDHFRAVSSLSAYIKVFFEYPSIALDLKSEKHDSHTDGRGQKIAWELNHREAKVAKFADHFNSEYLYVSSFSLLLSFISAVCFIAYAAINYKALEKGVLSGIGISAIIIVCFVYIVILIKYFYRVYEISDIGKHIQIYPDEYFIAYLHQAVEIGFYTLQDRNNCIVYYDKLAQQDKIMREHIDYRDRQVEAILKRKTWFFMPFVNIVKVWGRRKRGQKLNQQRYMQSMRNVDKIQHLIDFGVIKPGEGAEIAKYYAGQPFDTKDAGYQELLSKSKEWCNEYNAWCKDASPEGKKRRDEILNKLFPGHGEIYGVGYGISVVAGAVDLGDNCYIGAHVTFHADTIVHTGDYFICAPKVVFGQSDQVEHEASVVTIRNDVWACAAAKIWKSIIIESDVIVALGCDINTDLSLGGCIYFHDKQTKIISKESYKKAKKEKKKAIKPYKDLIDKTKQKLINHNITTELAEYGKLMLDTGYNSLEVGMVTLNDYAHTYCVANADVPNRLSELFGAMGKNCIIGTGVFVDTPCSVILGNNVKIGNNVILMGCIIIEDDVTIEDDVLLTAIGHCKKGEGRHPKDRGQKKLMINTSGYIIIKKACRLGRGAVIGPNIVIDTDVKAGSIVKSNTQLKNEV